MRTCPCSSREIADSDPELADDRPSESRISARRNEAKPCQACLRPPFSPLPRREELRERPGVRIAGLNGARPSPQCHPPKEGSTLLLAAFPLNWLETTILLVAWTALVVDVMRQQWISPRGLKIAWIVFIILVPIVSWIAYGIVRFARYETQVEPVTVRTLQFRLARSLTEFGDTKLGDLRAGEIAAWEAGLPPRFRYSVVRALSSGYTRTCSSRAPTLRGSGSTLFTPKPRKTAEGGARCRPRR